MYQGAAIKCERMLKANVCVAKFHIILNFGMSKGKLKKKNKTKQRK